MDLNKLKGIIVAVALGDALGAPHEFKYQQVEYTGKLEYPVKLFNRFQGESVYPVGSVTDDTQMTMVLFRHLIVNELTYNPEKIVLEYEQWAKSAKFLGKNTRELFKGVTTYKGYLNRYAKKFNIPVSDWTQKSGASTARGPISDDIIGNWTQSNGSLMRCSPFVLFTDYGNLMTDIKLTNPHPNNIQAGLIYIYIMRELAVNNHLPPIDELFKYTESWDITQVLNDVKNKTVRSIFEKSVKGWVCTALYCALYSIYNIPTFKEAAEYFIKQKGDTDTNAAILGALYGARDGFQKLYLENKDNLDILLRNDELKDLDVLLEVYHQ